MRLDHCCLNVQDMDRAIAFYESSFGMSLLSRRHIERTNADIAFLGFEDAGEDAMRLELTHWRDWADEDYTEGSRFDHIAITVPDCRGLVEELRGEGVEVPMEPYEMGSSGSVIGFVKDPEGNWVELIQRAE